MGYGSVIKEMLTLFSFFLLLHLCIAQNSFANTKFELSPDLPVEELPPIAASEDGPAKKESAKTQQAKPHDMKPVEAIRTQPQPVVAVTTVKPSQPVTIATVPTLPTLPTLPPLGGAPITLPSMAPFTFPTLPTAPPGPPFAFPGLPTIATPPTMTTTPASVPQRAISPVTPSHSVQLVRASSPRDHAELWFREDFDTSRCPRDVTYVAQAFRQKFPRNLLKNGKEAVLADLLSARLKECLQKQTKNHWNRVYDLLGRMNLPPTETDECRTGLLQEQIACMNVHSFSCQFIQPSYQFRLVPTRIVVQEARLAEDGAEKCRKVVRKLKKQLEH